MSDDETGLDLEYRVAALERNGIPGVRDFFATSALAMLAQEGIFSRYDYDAIAKRAYKIADAMMKQREGK